MKNRVTSIHPFRLPHGPVGSDAHSACLGHGRVPAAARSSLCSGKRLLRPLPQPGQLRQGLVSGAIRPVLREYNHAGRGDHRCPGDHSSLAAFAFARYRFAGRPGALHDHPPADDDSDRRPAGAEFLDDTIPEALRYDTGHSPAFFRVGLRDVPPPPELPVPAPGPGGRGGHRWLPLGPGAAAHLPLHGKVLAGGHCPLVAVLIIGTTSSGRW